MTAWWYADKDKKTGPVETDRLRLLLETEKIGPKTMLWHEGMEAWRPLEEVDELNELKAAIPPPLPPKATPDPLGYPLATRWPRFFARIFDAWWEILLVSFVFVAVLGRYSASFVEWINGPGASQLLGFLCLPIALSLDALLYRVVGNTPGKALLGLKAGTLDGKPLSFAQYLSRNFSMWASGLAFGLPLINLFTMANQSRRLGKGLQASYDEPTGFRVRSKPSVWVCKIAFGFAFASLFVVMAVLNSTEQATQRQAILSTAQESYSWVNPLTRLSAKIDSRWKFSAQANDDGQQIYMFTEQAGRAVVILGSEQAPGYSGGTEVDVLPDDVVFPSTEHMPSYTLEDYVRAFQKSKAANMRFSDGGRFFARDGHQIWQGSGSTIDNTSNRLNIQVIQFGSAFWRVVTDQTMPYDYSDALVQQLRAALWSTVK
jgi:uncharacterized RDD family membrane protein YckC